MDEKSRILEDLRQEFDRWEALLAELGEEQITRRQLPGEWSIKDVIAHLWAWQQRTLARLEAGRDNREPQFPEWPAGLDPNEEEDLEAINDWIFETNREKPWSQVYTDWRRQYQRIIELGQAIPAEDLLEPGRYRWLDPYPLSRILEATVEHHHIEHLEPLTEFLGQ